MAEQVDHKPPTFPERIILFGSEGGFSRPVLTRLLAHGVAVAAVVMPGVATRENGDDRFPIAMQRAVNASSLAGLASAHDVPVLRTQNIHDQQLFNELSALAADVLLVACFPLILPQTIWQLPRLACWNLHPSLLPKYRGPAPLFWQLRNKEQHTGVSLHEVTDQIDAGNIVAQQARPLPTNTGTAELDEWVAKIGVDLFLQAMEQYHQDCLTTIRQDEAAASYFPLPDKNDGNELS